MKRRRIVWGITGVIIFGSISTAITQEHPFLIVRESEYPELQARATQSPWKEMKKDAIEYINNMNYSTSGDILNRAHQMRDIASTGALAYILDPANRTFYKNKLRDTLLQWDNIYNEIKPKIEEIRGDGWAYAVPPGGAYFNSVLALDIIYNDLTASERKAVEGKLRKVSNLFWNTNEPHKLNTYGVRGIWAVYEGNVDRINSSKTDYRNRLNYLTVPGGVFFGGTEYARLRLGSNRLAKAYFMDVLEFTGYDNSYYSDPMLRNFYEWLYGYATTPTRQHYYYGDTGGSTVNAEAAILRAYRFSDKAARLAAWALKDRKPLGRLLHYVLMGRPMSAPEKPKSRIIWDGGAWFLEDNPFDWSLAGVLWNCTDDVPYSHAHKEVNALHLNAYGEHVLRNSGYAGWKKGVYGFDWDYVHNCALSGNTVLNNGRDHDSKAGGGITEGFIAPRFDYACGTDGPAVSGRHDRNFVFVHPQDGRVGYFVVFDEVSFETANVLLHPNADNYKKVSDKCEYTFKVSPMGQSGHYVHLSIFLGTVPDSVDIKDGLLAGGKWHDPPGGFVGKYLYSTYYHKPHIVTILFPYDASHPKGNISRILANGISGANINLGESVIDYAIESMGTGEVSHGGVTFRGLATLYRKKNGAVSFYFVRKGHSFDDGASPRQGFFSSSEVSVYIKDKEGKIISPGTGVTFYYPDISGVILNGDTPAKVGGSGKNWIKVTIPEGTHGVEFLAGG